MYPIESSKKERLYRMCRIKAAKGERLLHVSEASKLSHVIFFVFLWASPNLHKNVEERFSDETRQQLKQKDR